MHTQQHRGYGFIQFTHENQATPAMTAMNGFELAGRPLRVSWATVQPRSQPLAGAAAPAAIDINAALAAAMGQAAPAPAAPVAVAAPAVATLAAAALTMPGTAAAPAVPAPAVAAVPAAAAVPVTDSRCVMLRNLVSLEEAKDTELKDEIMEEVEQYGKVEQLEIHQFTVSNFCCKHYYLRIIITV
jgi:RNA recognition motif. (a.k.a. RRM, RBD, or RNP domain)